MHTVEIVNGYTRGWCATRVFGRIECEVFWGKSKLLELRVLKNHPNSVQFGSMVEEKGHAERQVDEQDGSIMRFYMHIMHKRIKMK